MKKQLSLGICVFLFLSLLMGTVLAQDRTVYTQVGLWDVPRAKWGDFVKFYEKYEKPVMERLFAEGVLVEHGFESNGLHDPNDYSHASWISAYSLADLEKALDAYTKSLGANADAMEAEFAGMVTKHKDLVVRSHFYGAKSVKMDNGYSFGSSVRVERGHGSDYRKAWETWAKPVYDKLLADGVIVAYTLDEAYYRTDEDQLGRMWTWYVVEDVANKHIVDDAFNAMRAEGSEAERTARTNNYWEMVIDNSYRNGFSRLIYFQTK
jgi:hypothetical protein